jgi:hypothetical protein
MMHVFEVIVSLSVVGNQFTMAVIAEAASKTFFKLFNSFFFHGLSWLFCFLYGSSERFALAMFQHSAPILLAYGGAYANVNDVPIKNIQPFAIPFGIGRTQDETQNKSITSTLVKNGITLGFIWQLTFVNVLL